MKATRRNVEERVRRVPLAEKSAATGVPDMRKLDAELSQERFGIDVLSRGHATVTYVSRCTRSATLWLRKWRRGALLSFGETT